MNLQTSLLRGWLLCMLVIVFICSCQQVTELQELQDISEQQLLSDDSIEAFASNSR